MGQWQSFLNADPIDWLLETDNPSVRYFPLRTILEKPEHNPEVTKAKADIMTNGTVPAIFNAQHKDGYWTDPRPSPPPNTTPPSGSSSSSPNSAPIQKTIASETPSCSSSTA